MSQHYNLIKVAETIDEVRRLYLAHPGGLKDSQLAELMHTTRMAAWRYRKTLNCKETDERGVYVYVPTDADVALAQSIIAQSMLVHDLVRE